MNKNTQNNSIITKIKGMNWDWDAPFTKREILVYDAVVLGAYAAFIAAYYAKEAYRDHKRRKAFRAQGVAR